MNILNILLKGNKCECDYTNNIIIVVTILLQWNSVCINTMGQPTNLKSPFMSKFGYRKEEMGMTSLPFLGRYMAVCAPRRISKYSIGTAASFCVASFHSLLIGIAIDPSYSIILIRFLFKFQRFIFIDNLWWFTEFSIFFFLIFFAVGVWFSLGNIKIQHLVICIKFEVLLTINSVFCHAFRQEGTLDQSLQFFSVIFMIFMFR